jgi:hypothetical protein
MDNTIYPVDVVYVQKKREIQDAAVSRYVSGKVNEWRRRLDLISKKHLKAPAWSKSQPTRIVCDVSSAIPYLRQLWIIQSNISVARTSIYLVDISFPPNHTIYF